MENFHGDEEPEKAWDPGTGAQTLNSHHGYFHGDEET